MRKILLGALAVGVLDILDPILFWYFYRDVKPMRILQGIAGGLLGREAARTGGISTALLGLAIHFFIAFTVVLVYHLASRKIGVLVRHPIFCGVIYGLLVYLVMNFVVLPLSALGPPKFDNPLGVANGLFAHVFCVGIPAALSASIGAYKPAVAMNPRA